MNKSLASSEETPFQQVLERCSRHTPLLPVAGLLGNLEVANKIGDQSSHLGLLEHRHNLLDTDSLAFHDVLIPLSRANDAGNSPSMWYENGRADQHGDHS